MCSVQRDNERLSISSPEFNIREITKQILLLEDHLFDVSKRCQDCIRKHTLMIEALAEEAITLNPKSRWVFDCHYLAERTRNWMSRIIDGEDMYNIAQEMRHIRKQLVPIVSDPRKNTFNNLPIFGKK